MPDKTIFITHKIDGALANASSVRLSSNDGSFGIKQLDNGDVIVPDGTEVNNPSAGRYEYTFNANNSQVYVASWRIVSQSGDNPVFKTQTVGPFVVSGQLFAVADVRGTLEQNTVNSLQLRITDFNGMAVDPSSISVTVRNANYDIVESNGTSVENVVPEKVANGFYVIEWQIDKDEVIGKHIITWTYVVGGLTFKEVQECNVAGSATIDTGFYAGSRFILRDSLMELLHCAQRIPVYHEQAMPTADRKTYRFTKGNWNQTPRARVYRNQEILLSGHEVNHFQGFVTFDDILLIQDVVAADYNFRWFSDEELDLFIDNGISKLNAFPPQRPAFNAGTLISQGTQHIPAVLYGAATDAMRNLMMCIQFQEPAQYFGGLERAQQVFGNLETLKKNYESSWEMLLEQKKYGPYPTSKLVVVPEFTLPGGRSRWFRYLFSSNAG